MEYGIYSKEDIIDYFYYDCIDYLIISHHHHRQSHHHHHRMCRMAYRSTDRYLVLRYFVGDDIYVLNLPSASLAQYIPFSYSFYTLTHE